MKTFLAKLGISGVALAIFLGIMAVVCIYFFVMLEKNQKVLEKRGYQTLEKLGFALNQKDKNYANVVKYIRVVIPADDTVPGIPPGFGPIAESLKIRNKKATAEPDFMVYKAFKTIEKHGQHDSASPKYPENEYKTGKRIGKEKKNLQIALKDSVIRADSVYPRSDSVIFQIPFADFIKPLIRNDFFSGYALIRNSQIVFSSLPGVVKLTPGDLLSIKGKVQPAGSAFSLVNGGTDSKDDLSVIQSGLIDKVTIECTSYLLFIIPLNFQNNPNCYLGGVIEEKAFIREKQSLPSDRIVLSILFLLLIVSSLPLIKVAIMTPRQKLTRPGANLIGISIATAMLILVILLSQMVIRFTLRSDQFDQLVNLNDAVRTSFII